MTSVQEYYGENARWIVRETYFGVIDETRTICSCHSLDDARMIINAMVKAKRGRTYSYKAEKIADDYREECDAIQETDIFTGEVYDYSNFLKGVSCLR